MILGLGSDIIEIQRIREGLDKRPEKFLARLFTANEQSYCQNFSDPAPHYAARFSAKEAVAKALGIGFGKELSWKDIEILNDERGKPHVHFTARANLLLHTPKVAVTLSHSREYAMAVALWMQHIMPPQEET